VERQRRVTVFQVAFDIHAVQPAPTVSATDASIPGRQGCRHACQAKKKTGKERNWMCLDELHGPLVCEDYDYQPCGAKSEAT